QPTTKAMRPRRRTVRGCQRIWSAAGSEAPRRFRNHAWSRIAVSPLRSATALHNVVVGAHSGTVVVLVGLLISLSLGIPIAAARALCGGRQWRSGGRPRPRRGAL